MTTCSTEHFDRHYQSHLKHLKRKGLQPKTFDAYARAIRRLGDYFGHQIDDLSEAQLTDYFSDLIESHSWSTIKLDLYGLEFYTTYVLHNPWAMPNLVKPPKAQRLPDIVTVDEAQRLFATTRTLSYRVFYFTLYSLGGGPDFAGFMACRSGAVLRPYDATFFSVDGGRPPSRPFLLAASALAGLFDMPPFRPRLRIHADVPRTPRANAGTYRSASSRGKCNPMPCPSMTISAISAGVAFSMP
ncbi:site-specific integrase [Acidithiobacillus sp. IBUN Pt1247-S3]|uniref:site-specific integrase n=1 Tax=Acidithiobacillus sp. IBUN Pt1247-S3 TaxID=3166642 RepID=UPI0034E3FD2E